MGWVWGLQQSSHETIKRVFFLDCIGLCRSLLGGDDDDVQEEKPMLRQLSPTDFEAVLAHYPPVE
eukprot:421700-Amphidinium_carterae.1